MNFNRTSVIVHLSQLGRESFRIGKDFFFKLGLGNDRNDHYLLGGYTWWYAKSIVISVNHDHSPNRTCSQSPRGCIGEFDLTVLVRKFDIGCFREALT